MCEDIRENIIEVLDRNLLFGNDVIIDDFFCINLLNNKINLVSIVTTDDKKLIDVIKKNNYILEIPEWIDSIDKNALASLNELSREMFNYKMKFGLKFPDKLEEIPSKLLSSPISRTRFIIGKNICRESDFISESYVDYYDYIYLPNFEITKDSLKINCLHHLLYSSNRKLRVYFKNYQGTLGSLSVLYHKSSIKDYSQRALNIVSELVKQEFEENGECVCGKSTLYRDIYGLCLKDTIETKKVWKIGVDIELLFIPTWSSSYEDYEISEKGKLLLSTGNFNMEKSVSLLSPTCFNLSEDVQNRIGTLNIELSPMLKKIEKYSFKNLYCLEGLTIVNKAELEDMWLYNCNNLKCLNLLSYKYMEFNINTISGCNESAILNLLDWSGTIKEYKIKFMEVFDSKGCYK